MPAPPSAEPITFSIPALATWRRTGGRPDPTAPRLSKLVGYYTQGARPNHTRLSEYQTWKDHVRAHAPPGLSKLRPVDEASRVRLDVTCYFASRTHADPENVRKGIVDALFPHGDKWVYGGHDHPRYDAARPRVEVTVTLFQQAGPPGRPAVAAPTATTGPRGPGPQTRRPTQATSPAPGPKGRGKAPARTAGKTRAPAAPRRGWWAALEAWVAGLGGKERRRAGRPSPRRRRR